MATSLFDAQKDQTCDEIESASQLTKNVLQGLRHLSSSLRGRRRSRRRHMMDANAATIVARTLGNALAQDLKYASDAVEKVDKWLNRSHSALRSYNVLSSPGRPSYQAVEHEFGSLNWHREVLREADRYYFTIASMIGCKEENWRYGYDLRLEPQQVEQKLIGIRKLRPIWNHSEVQEWNVKLQREARNAILIRLATLQPDVDEEPTAIIAIEDDRKSDGRKKSKKELRGVTRSPAARELPAAVVNGNNWANPPAVAKRKPKFTVNERMAAMIQLNWEARGWNSPKWARELKCARSTVVDTETWQDLKMAREKIKAQLAVDRRRRPRASDLRHR